MAAGGVQLKIQKITSVKTLNATRLSSLFTPNRLFAQLFCMFFLLTVGNGCFAQLQLGINSRMNIVMNGSINMVFNSAAFVNNGTFNAGNSSTVYFTGYQDSSISYINGTSTSSFNNLTITKAAGKAAKIKSAAVVSNTLTVNGGLLYTGNLLTLKSVASLTARVAAIPLGCNIYGKTNVEKYYPAKRAWRLVTAPVTGANTFYDCWQNGGVYQAGRGTYISGPNAAVSNGLDGSPQNKSSLKKWDKSSQSLVSVDNTYASMSEGSSGSADNTGYLLFIRGDRTYSNFTTTTSNTTTITSTGTLQTGTQVFPAATTSGAYTLIGNPYASPVDFSTITRTNVVNRFYIWDPTINTLGAYVMLDDIGNSGSYIKSVNASSQTKHVQSSQAFFIQTNSNGAASISFAETNKSASNNNLVARPSGNALQGLRVNLYIKKPDSSLLYADGAIAEFNEAFNEAVLTEDALKFTNLEENLGFRRNGIILSAERRPVIKNTDTVFLNLWRATSKNYQFVVEPTGMEAVEMFLKDGYLNTWSPLNTTENTLFDFNIDADPASAAANRFSIVLKSMAVLPVKIVAFSAYAAGNNIAVDWAAENEINTAKYDVEKSSDGLTFTKVYSQAANHSGANSMLYKWTDVYPGSGIYYYRIKSYERDQTVKFSSIARVELLGKTGIIITSNPVTDGKIALLFNQQQPGKYAFAVFTVSGECIYTKQAVTGQRNTTITFMLPGTTAPGMYKLNIIKPDNTSITLPLLIQ